MLPITSTLMTEGAAAMMVSAVVMALFGGTQRVYLGFWWWVSAQWLVGLGLLMANLVASRPNLLPLVNLMLLQWPITVLGGVRRFYPRHTLRVALTGDWLVLAVVFVLWFASWVGPDGEAASAVVFSVGASVLYVYSAVLTFRLHALLRSSALKILVFVQCLGGLVYALRTIQAHSYAMPWLNFESLHVLGGVVNIAVALIMVYLCVHLTYERSARKLRESQRQLQYLADMDMLTEVPNRRHFYELADKVLASSDAGEASIVMFDLDHFKRINDEMGHAAGDSALRVVARCVRDTLRARDVAGRIGGDEFALLLPQTPGQDAVLVADRIVTQLKSETDPSDSVSLSLSFGVVLVQPGEGIDDAMRRADQALYEAKRQGRSCAVIASGTDNEPVFGQSQAMGLSAS